jgi:hypothetical protein
MQRHLPWDFRKNFFGFLKNPVEILKIILSPCFSPYKSAFPVFKQGSGSPARTSGTTGVTAGDAVSGCAISPQKRDLTDKKGVK